MSSAWKIETWSRELGRGSIRAPQIGSLPFDGSRADADDFHLGEPVLVELGRKSGCFYVKRVSPDVPRFRLKGASIIPPLLRETADRADRILSQLPPRQFDRIARLCESELEIEGVDYDYTAYDDQLRYRLVFRGPLYVDLPSRWETKMARSASDTERAYLADRFKWAGGSFLAITWITEERRFHFVACDRMEIARWK